MTDPPGRTSDHRTTWTDRLRQGCLVVVGTLTATPAVAVVVPSDLVRQYGIVPDDPTTLALLQHRGGLQAVLGAAIIIAAWRPAWTVPAAAAAILTKGLFLALVLTDPAVRPRFPVLPIAFDAAAVIALALIAVGAHREQRRRGHDPLHQVTPGDHPARRTRR